MKTLPIRFPPLFFRCFALGVLFLPVAGQAHRVSSVSLISHINTEKNSYVLDAAMEVMPSEDQALNDQISPEDAAREFAQEYLVVMFDRTDQKPEMAIETVDSSDEATPQELRRQQVLTKLTGAIPEGAKEFLLYLDPRCPMAVVMVVIKNGQPGRQMQVILAGEYSRPVSVVPLVEGDPFSGGNGGTAGAAPQPGPTVVGASDPTAVPETVSKSEGKAAFLAGWWSFLDGNGLPWLLTIGIFLLTLGRKSVFLQVALVLVTQSIIVALAAWKLIPAPTWAGPGLAVVVVVICGEAIFHHHVRVWRLPLVMAGGLLTGILLAGSTPFATTFATRGAASKEVILYLLGTESALVLVAFVSAAVLLPLSRFEWYRRSVVQPVAIVLIGFAIFSGVEKYL
jgi:hypothetical protein